MIVYETEDKHF